MKKRVVIIPSLILILLIVLAAVFIFSLKKENPSYILHEWGVLLGNSVRTAHLDFLGGMTAKPVIYLYSDNNFNLSLSVAFENGNAIEVWPYIPTGKKISWNNFRISANCNTTPFPEQQYDMKEIYELGNYVVDNANCITYENTTSKILFYNGKIDFGNIITGYYVDLGDKKQIILTNNLNQTISNIYVNYKEPFWDWSHGIDIGMNATLGILKIDELKAGETKTFEMNVNIYNFSGIPFTWKNQGEEFKQKLINNGLYSDEADKFMVAWEDTFFGIDDRYGFNLDYRNGMNIIYILPEEKYSELLKLETSIEPKEIKRISVVYSQIFNDFGGIAGGTTRASVIAQENCGDYTNQVRIYCNPFLSTYNKELCNQSEENYKTKDCCKSG